MSSTYCLYGNRIGLLFMIVTGAVSQLAYSVSLYERIKTRLGLVNHFIIQTEGEKIARDQNICGDCLGGVNFPNFANVRFEDGKNVWAGSDIETTKTAIEQCRQVCSKLQLTTEMICDAGFDVSKLEKEKYFMPGRIHKGIYYAHSDLSWEKFVNSLEIFICIRD